MSFKIRGNGLENIAKELSKWKPEEKIIEIQIVLHWDNLKLDMGMQGLKII